MEVSRRSALKVCAGTVGICVAGLTHAKDSYPNKQIRYVIPYVVGGGADTMARLVRPAAARALGQDLVPDNRGGANGNIGAAVVAHSRPDGYTIMLAAANLAISQSLYKHLPFDVLRDFAPVSLLAKTPSIIAVHPSMPIHDLQQLITLAKASPGKYNYASDQGGPQALGMDLLKARAGINITEIPYTGTADGTIAAVGGHVNMIMAPANVLLALVESGRLRPIAVSDSKRLAQLPDVPTVAESGLPGYAVNQSYSIFAPAGTPRPMIETLNHAFVSALRQPGLREEMKKLVLLPVGTSPQGLASYLRKDIAQWAYAIKTAHVVRL